MPLFVAEHHHRPESCPAGAATGRQLLALISAARAASHGITIEAEALIDGQHRLLLVLDAANADAVTGFLGFLLGYGELDVLAASTAEQAAERGGCPAAPPRPETEPVSTTRPGPPRRHDGPVLAARHDDRGEPQNEGS